MRCYSVPMSLFKQLRTNNNNNKDPKEILRYLCSCIRLHGNQYCRCNCKIPLCYYKLRSCYTGEYFHRIRQYLR